MLLTQREKKLLILYAILAIFSLFASMFITEKYPYKEDSIVNRKIHVIHTSGEIEPNFQEIYKQNKEIIGHFDIHTYSPFINSSNITPKDWNDIAKDIGVAYNNYDAFVIIHNSNTISYTASAISFMLENLGKPVIFTNGELLTALTLASRYKIPEVVVVSGNDILRGCRCITLSETRHISPNYPSLTEETSLTPPQEIMQIKFMNPKVKVVVIKVFPGIDAKFLTNITKQTSIHGIILELYSNGTAPIDDTFLAAIAELAKKGVIIISVSQTPRVRRDYVTNIGLIDAGVVSGEDMTTPAAFGKLYYLLSNVKEQEVIGKLIDNNFRGELTK